jgi:hypothetical protein
VSRSKRLSPLWFLGAQVATLGLVALVAWLIHGPGEGFFDDSDIAYPGSGPRLTVGEALELEEDEFPAGFATVVGRVDAVVEFDDAEVRHALVLSPARGDGELLVVPEGDARIPQAILRAGDGVTVRVVGQLRVATATNPPPDRLLAEFLGEPMLEAQRISLGLAAELRDQLHRQP